MKKIGIIFCLLLALFSCQQQVKKVTIAQTESQEKIVKWYKRISYVSNSHPDSLVYFAAKSQQLAAKEPRLYKALDAFIQGVSYQNTSSYELSKKAYEKVLQLVPESKYDTIKARTYIGLGSYYKNTGDYPQAFRYLYQALKIYEKANNKYGIASSHGSIAQIYLQKEDLQSSKDHLKVGLKALGNDKKNQFYLISSHTLANAYGMSGEYQNALDIDKECIAICEQIQSPRNKATFLDNKANCYMYSNQLDSAKYYFEECLKIDVAVGEKKQIGDTYTNLGNLALFKNDYAEAEKNLNASIAIFKEINQKPNLVETYAVLIDVYGKQGKLKQALAMQMEKESIYKQLISEKKEAALAEFNIVYETQKKEQELAENKVKLLQNEAEAQQKNTYIIAIALVAIFVALLGFLINRQQKIKTQQQNQEYKLKAAIAHIETQNQLQEQRLSISRDLHDNIGAQLTFIISSIENIKYAFDIKNPKLDDKLNSITQFTKSTIVELRDTIWAMNSTAITFEALQARIINFIEKAKDAKDKIRFDVVIDSSLNDSQLTSVEGMNIFRTLQEAIHNAIKYADASEIAVTVKKIDGDLEITIKDNGIGFDTATIGNGHGLQNMRARMESIGATFHIHSEANQGTTIFILHRHWGKSV